MCKLLVRVDARHSFRVRAFLLMFEPSIRQPRWCLVTCRTIQGGSEDLHAVVAYLDPRAGQRNPSLGLTLRLQTSLPGCLIFQPEYSTSHHAPTLLHTHDLVLPLVQMVLLE